MKKVRIIRMALLAILTCVNFASCSSDDAPTEEKEETRLVGTWQGRFDYGDNEYQILTLTFSADGKYTKVRKEHEDGKDYTYTSKGTYTYNSSIKKIEAKFIDSEGYTINDDFYVKSVSATTLILIDWSDWERGHETDGGTLTRL